MSDLIDRQAAIDYFVINVGFHDEDGYPIEDTDELRKIWTEYFDGIPPAQPERIRGRWTRDNACSECGCQPWFSGDIHNYNFCPNCGAEMEVTT